MRAAPEGDGVHAGNESEARQPQIPAPSRHKAPVTAVMPDDEQKRDKNSIRHAKHDVDRKSEIGDRTEQRYQVEQDMNEKEPKPAAQGTRIRCFCPGARFARGMRVSA